MPSMPSTWSKQALSLGLLRRSSCVERTVRWQSPKAAIIALANMATYLLSGPRPSGLFLRVCRKSLGYF